MGNSDGTCGTGATDGELLDRFVGKGDEDAFAELVNRYYGMVLGVCRRIVHDEQTAEDAFQATFLVLARRASRVRHRASVAAWLHAVACRTAWRANHQRQQRREEALRDDVAGMDDVWVQIADRHEQQLLDEEINRLPSRYRQPLVLRYLMGKSNRQVAEELGLSVGVVEGRLKRGKDRLRLRLAKRGISIATVLAVVGASSEAVAAATKSALVAATAKAAVAFRGGATLGSGFSQGAVQLAKGELAMSTSGSVTVLSGTVVAVVIGGLALGRPGAVGKSPDAIPIQNTAITVPADFVTPSDAVPIRLASAEKPLPAPESPKLGITTESSTAAMAISPGEKMIVAKLDGPTKIDFIETPLQDVIIYLEDYHGIQIEVDQPAFDDVGLGTDTPISRTLEGIPLRTALQLILRDIDLTYVPVDGVLLITTPNGAASMPLTRVYPVGDLVGLGASQTGESSWLTDAVQALRKQADINVRPDDAVVIEATVAGKSVLVVTDSYTTHEEIERLLRGLRQAAAMAPSAPTQQAAASEK
jgi:RNA polymerase sigma factor (sigma-70 family)